jgi:nitrous oxidase accessory protein NosD
MARCPLLGVLLALLLGAGVVHAETLVVPGDHATIQAAVDAAGPGDTIIVKKGVHPGPVVVQGKTDLTIKGKGKAVLDGQSTGVALTIRDCVDVTVTKITITNAGAEAVLVDGGDDVGIWKVKVLNPGTCGVLVQGSKRAWVETCVIEEPG